MPFTTRAGNSAYFLVLFLSTTHSVSYAAAGEKWQTFESPAGFSISYPPGWYRLHVSPARLDIFDSRKGRESGIIVSQGHVSISASEPADLANRSMGQALGEIDQFAGKIVERKSLPPPPGSNCGQFIREVTGGSAYGDTTRDWAHHIPPQVQVKFYCRTSSGKLAIIGALFWESDSKRAAYEATVKRMAESIKMRP